MQQPGNIVRALLAACALAVPAAGPATAAMPDTGGPSATPSLAPLVEKVSPAVVNIATRGTVKVENPMAEHPFFRRFFGEDAVPQQRRVQSLGSGVIVDADEGYILTNHHVIAQADEITVALNDKREFQAEVIGSDPATDIAVIRIDADNLSAVEMGDSSTLRTGDYVVALGNPFGLDHTVTSGIVSGLGRSLTGRVSGVRISDFIQTDASINPGNSGGALVNLQGQLVGINSAILSRGGGNIGIGFAVPVNLAETVMGQLIEYGEVRRGVLGVRVQDLTPAIAESMDLPETTDGALIAQVTPGSAAAKAGLEPGDVVTAVDGEPIDGASELAKVIGLTELGTEVQLTVIRDGDKQTVSATLTEPAGDGQAAASQAGEGVLEGVQLAELTPQHPLHGEVQGVVVSGVEPGSAAARQLQEGDVITSVNRQKVTSLAEFRQAAGEAERLLLRVHRGDAAMFMVIE